MGCPRCGFSEPGSAECPRCGVVFAKLDRPGALKTPTAPARPWMRSLAWRYAVLVLVLSLALAALLSRHHPRSLPKATEPAAPPDAGRNTAASPTGPSQSRGPTGSPQESADVEQALPSWVILPSPVASPPSRGSVALAPTAQPRDADDLAALLRRVEEREALDSSHIDQAEALFARRPGHAPTRRLLRELLWEAARQAEERDRLTTGRRYVERATELLPEDRVVWLKLIESHEAARRWAEGERAAERGLSELPDDTGLHVALARALSQQGRDREAADLLRRHLIKRPGAAVARRELARLERVLDSVAGLEHRTSSHFSVHFDGEADDDLGRALLEVLEEKHEMLARTLGCEPEREIPVVLLPRRTFREVSSAPHWAAGYFSHSDARIRIGTRNLAPGFVPLDLERLLTHELAHAFIFARTGGAVPTDINEGLAQYLSGKRLGYRLDPSRAEVREGRMNVRDFYDSSLSFAEYLIGRYRQQGLNELLEYAGETGSAEQAFRRAFARTYEETREEWLKSLR